MAERNRGAQRSFPKPCLRAADRTPLGSGIRQAGTTRFSRTTLARTGATGRGPSTSGSIPSIRHSGANTRRACGDASSSARISPSSSTPRSCDAYPAACCGTNGSNQPNRRGRTDAQTLRAPPVTRTRGETRTRTRPARNRASNPCNRPSIRRTRPQISTITAADNAPPTIRAATARPNSSRISAIRSERETTPDAFIKI